MKDLIENLAARIIAVITDEDISLGDYLYEQREAFEEMLKSYWIFATVPTNRDNKHVFLYRQLVRGFIARTDLIRDEDDVRFAILRLRMTEQTMWARIRNRTVDSFETVENMLRLDPHGGDFSYSLLKTNNPASI